MSLLCRPIRNGLVILAIIMIGFLAMGACGSEKSHEPKLPKGETAHVPTTAKPPPTTAVTAPRTNFETWSRGVDRSDYDENVIWHGKIDGVECIRYGPHFMCKGFSPS